MFTSNLLDSAPTEPLADPQTVARAVALVLAVSERTLNTKRIERASGALHGRPELSAVEQLVLGITNSELAKSPALLNHELDGRDRVHDLRDELASRDEYGIWDFSDFEGAEHDLELAQKWEIHAYTCTGSSPFSPHDETGSRLTTRDRRIQADAERITARKQEEALRNSVPPLLRDCVARRVRRVKNSDVGRAVEEAERRVNAAEEVIKMYDDTFHGSFWRTTPTWADDGIKVKWLPYLSANCPKAIRNEPEGGPTIDVAVAEKHIAYLKGTGIRQLRSDLYSRRNDLQHEVEEAERVLRRLAGDGHVDLAALQELFEEDVAVERTEESTR